MPKGDWIKFKPEFEEKILKLHDQGKSATEIGKITKKFTSSILRVLRRNGRKLNRVYQGKGSEHSQWKGGRGIKSGYWSIYMPEHPRAINIGRVYEHIIVAEKKYGKTIPKNEPIHHVDFDRLNNNPKNLHLCTGHKQHRDLHVSLEIIARELYLKGVIGFENGGYFLK